jgi:hypothetical protein
MVPAEWAGEIEQFEKENPGQVKLEKAVQGKEGVRSLGFEPITTVVVGAWLLKFVGGLASSLATKLIVDKLAKKLASDKSAKPVEIQIAFPNGNVVTIRAENAKDADQLRRMVEENLRP